MSAKTVIEIWLMGGPSHLETFDPKPSAARDYNGELKAIDTNVPGMQVHEWLPELAKCADLYSLIRSMTHPHNGHETAVYLMQTGRMPGGKSVYPAIGTIIGMEKKRRGEYVGDLPPSVILTREKGRFSEVGFLDPVWEPLVTGGDPTASVFTVDGITPPGGLTPEKIAQRFELAAKLDTLPVPLPEFDRAGEEAKKLIAGDGAKAFDLSAESAETRAAYGLKSRFGQSLLVARRLAEYGVPYVTVNLTGWDSHKKHFETMRKTTAEFDVAVSTLLKDLKARGLLDTTLVWVSGEFGRRPKIEWEAPWNGGRNHYSKCFSALVAGGGFKGGCVVGESDANGENVKSRPVAPQDLLGSICELCGIDPDGPLTNSRGIEATILPPQSEAGRLKEIYA